MKDFCVGIIAETLLAEDSKANAPGNIEYRRTFDWVFNVLYLFFLILLVRERRIEQQVKGPVLRAAENRWRQVKRR